MPPTERVQCTSVNGVGCTAHGPNRQRGERVLKEAIDLVA